MLEEELLRKTSKLRAILTHEVFHFAWARAGNPVRQGWADLLTEELASGARGELGESAEVAKQWFAELRHVRSWKNYVCESFCDTASWYFSDRRITVSLATRWRSKRANWFREWCTSCPEGIWV